MKLTLPTKHICSFSPHLNTTADKQQTLIKGFLMPVKESRLPAAAQQLGTLVLFSRERSDPTSENELGGHSFYSPSGYIISTNRTAQPFVMEVTRNGQGIVVPQQHVLARLQGKEGARDTNDMNVRKWKSIEKQI